MLLTLLLIPLLGIFIISSRSDFSASNSNEIKYMGLTISIINLLISLVIWILFDFSQNQFQFVQEYHQVSFWDWGTCLAYTGMPLVLSTNGNLNPQYVRGFCDGESSFTVSIQENPRYNLGWEVKVSFSIGLHKKELNLLERFQTFFGSARKFFDFFFFSLRDTNNYLYYNTFCP